MMSEQLRVPSAKRHKSSDHHLTKPTFIASCSPFGPKVFLSDVSTIKSGIDVFMRNFNENFAVSHCCLVEDLMTFVFETFGMMMWFL